MLKFNRCRRSRSSGGRTIWTLVAALAALALFAAACGGDDDAVDPATDEESTVDEQTADADDGSMDDGSDDGSMDDGSMDDGSMDDGSMDDGSMDDGSMDDGSMDDGSMDDGSMDDGSMDDGSMDDGSMDDGSMDDASDITAAFVLVGPVGDAGWNWAHDQGRQYAEEHTGAATLFVESVPENAEDFKAFAIDFIDNDGADVIFGTSFGYMDAMEELAGEYPGVVFEHASGYKMNDTNFGNYFGRMYQPRYLSGLAAGAMTQTGNIGYVAAFPIPEVIRGINAFTLGVRDTNPDAQVHVNWTFTWFDPTIEGDTAKALLEAGADVIAMHQDSTAAGTAAQDAGARWVAYNSDMSLFAPEAWITAPVWNWGPRYAATIEAVADGSYKSGAYWGGMDDGIVGLAPLADDVPSATADLIASRTEEIVSGSWDVFTGPINDQDGKEMVAAGETMDDGSMLGMSWFVEGVVGNAAP